MVDINVSRSLAKMLLPFHRSTSRRRTICYLVFSLLLYIDAVNTAQLNNNQATSELKNSSTPKLDNNLVKITTGAGYAAQKIVPEISEQSSTASTSVNKTNFEDQFNVTNNDPMKNDSSSNDVEDNDEESATLVLDSNYLTTATPRSTGKQDDAKREYSSSGNNSNNNNKPSAARLTEEKESNAETTIEVKNEPSRIETNPDLNGVKEIEPFRRILGGSREMRDARIGDKVKLNISYVTNVLLKKTPYSEYWSAEEKWDNIYKKFSSIQDTMKDILMRNVLKSAEYYADITISPRCSEDLKFIQDYQKKSTNYKWLLHMADSSGKAEPGMLTGNLADLGHVVQCIRVRAPLRPSNETFEERFFEEQTKKLGERFRGKYCLATLRPVLPEKPYLVSRFSEILDTSILSNISYMGEAIETLKLRATETTIPDSVYELIDKEHNRLDQIPFESELFQYLILQRNFMYTLPRFIGVCYPSSCTQDDIRYSLQKSFDDQHQVVDMEFKCEIEEDSLWNWLNTSRLIAYVLFFLVTCIILSASIARYILIDKLRFDRRNLREGSNLANIIQTLDFLSMDKCAGILFIKTKPASPLIDKTKLENNRSTSIDALKGFLILILIYSQLIQLGCLPVPFMWSKWVDSMFPFYRSFATQIFINTSIWTEAFYVISSYLITAKILENYRPNLLEPKKKTRTQLPSFSSYMLKRYIRLTLPMIGFILLNYIWPMLSNGFVMQDQVEKIVEPCDKYAWTNVLLFHNHYNLNETCLWPTFVSASFFQLHIISFPIILILVTSLKAKFDLNNKRQIMHKIAKYSALSIMALIAFIGLIYPALMAVNQDIIVPFLIDYIDYDNYQRVIEWTVMPTYNHLTSYMFGIWLAYRAILERAENEFEVLSPVLSSPEWSGTFTHREGSFESVVSSATQDSNWRPLFKGPTMNNQSQHQHGNELNKSTSNKQHRQQHQQNQYELQHRHIADLKFNHQVIRRANSFSHRGIGDLFLNSLLNSLFALGILISLTSSWYWNGAGQPMSSTQTFWFMVGTKLLFTITFSYLFYKYIARRHNSEDPWMITRFLVPIGRMSLTVFYVSWIVIWFDLLSSLYQWHPSHYFVFEKFNEIIFMTLILSMLAYGAFEGPFKSKQYSRRGEKLKKQQQQQLLLSQQQQQQFNQHQRKHSNYEQQQQQSGPTIVTQAPILRSSTPTLRDIVPIQGFQNMFEPICCIVDEEGEDELSNNRLSSEAGGAITTGNYEQVQSEGKGGDKGFGTTSHSSPDHAKLRRVGDNSSGDETTKRHSMVGENHRVTGRHLSISDQYKLNAELRANYSFASIGLYESAGATDDLPQHNSNDPQVSLEPTSDNAKR